MLGKCSTSELYPWALLFWCFLCCLLWSRILCSPGWPLSLLCSWSWPRTSNLPFSPSQILRLEHYHSSTQAWGFFLPTKKKPSVLSTTHSCSPPSLPDMLRVSGLHQPSHSCSCFSHSDLFSAREGLEQGLNLSYFKITNLVTVVNVLARGCAEHLTLIFFKLGVPPSPSVWACNPRDWEMKAGGLWFVRSRLAWDLYWNPKKQTSKQTRTRAGYGDSDL